MELSDLLADSAATPEFVSDVLAYAAGATSERVHLVRRSPPVKVLRVLAQLLHVEPHLPIGSVSIDARSSCSSFDGRLDVHTAQAIHHYEFSWDCQWRAMEEGWTDFFGFPDQIRAASEFGWRCFRIWERVGRTETLDTAPAVQR
jgi:hypothetical protein